jgi:hypothetical protein
MDLDGLANHLSACIALGALIDVRKQQVELICGHMERYTICFADALRLAEQGVIPKHTADAIRDVFVEPDGR